MERGQYPGQGYWPEPAIRKIKTGQSSIRNFEEPERRPVQEHLREKKKPRRNRKGGHSARYKIAQLGVGWDTKKQFAEY
jgi:hypothetical protein